MSDKRAGLTYAPAYDPSTELDPSKVEPVKPQEDLEQLQYFRQQEAKRTMVARAILLSVIFLMLGANLLQSRQMHDDVLTNLDQTRLDLVALNEASTNQIKQLNTTVVALQNRVDELEAEAVAELAAPVP